MTLDEYQQQAIKTLIRHPDPLIATTILAMGVSGEAGEALDKWKKILVYQNGVASDQDKQELTKELADVVWYVAVLAHELGVSLDDLMQQNLEKVASRQKRGVLRGQGDNR